MEDNTKMTPYDELVAKLDLMYMDGAISDKERALYISIVNSDEDKLKRMGDEGYNELAYGGVATRETFFKLYANHIKKLASDGKVLLFPDFMEVDDDVVSAFSVKDSDSPSVDVASKIKKAAETFNTNEVYSQFGIGDVNSLAIKYKRAMLHGTYYDYSKQNSIRDLIAGKRVSNPEKKHDYRSIDSSDELLAKKQDRLLPVGNDKRGVVENRFESIADNLSKRYMKEYNGYVDFIKSWGGTIVSKLNTVEDNQEGSVDLA